MTWDMSLDDAPPVRYFKPRIFKREGNWVCEVGIQPPYYGLSRSVTNSWASALDFALARTPS